MASAVHKETSELSWVDIISSHVLSLLATPLPPPHRQRCLARWKQRTDREAVLTMFNTAGERRVGKSWTSMLFFFCSSLSFLFRGSVSGHLKAAPLPPPPSSCYVRLGLPILAPNMHTLPETDSECATFCSEVICFLTEEREAIVKERLPKGLVRWGKKRERHQSEINARQSRLVSIKPVTVWV